MEGLVIFTETLGPLVVGTGTSVPRSRGILNANRVPDPRVWRGIGFGFGTKMKPSALAAILGEVDRVGVRSGYSGLGLNNVVEPGWQGPISGHRGRRGWSMPSAEAEAATIAEIERERTEEIDRRINV